MQKLVDLLETMFGDLDLEDIDLEQLETDATKALHKEAAKAEEVAVAATHGPILADKIMHVVITSVPIPVEFGIPLESLPKTENIKVVSTKYPVKRVTHFYYNCRICSHSSQNKPSMMTHTSRCLQIKLVCNICKKEYELSKGAENHINEVHEGHCDPEAIETETGMATS